MPLLRALPRSLFVALSLALCLLLATIAPATVRAAADGPKVVVSIKPLHALVAAVMGDIGRPHLLLQGAASPHSYSLRPSDARALSEADLVFWVGPGFESFLVKPLQTLAGRATAVGLAAAPGVATLPYGAAAIDERPHANGETHDGEHEHEHEHEHGHDPDSFDPHIWLDPVNAAAMTTAIAAALGAADPDHAAAYRAKAVALRSDLEALTAELAAGLAPLRTRPFVTFHDAYGYLTKRFGLASAGAIALDPERPPGAARVAEIRRRVQELGVACVFAEPQFAPKLIAVVTEGTGARAGVLDPMGAALAPGPDAYDRLLRDLAAGLRGCLLPES